MWTYPPRLVLTHERNIFGWIAVNFKGKNKKAKNDMPGGYSFVNFTFWWWWTVVRHKRYNCFYVSCEQQIDGVMLWNTLLCKQSSTHIYIYTPIALISDVPKPQCYTMLYNVCAKRFQNLPCKNHNHRIDFLKMYF